MGKNKREKQTQTLLFKVNNYTTVHIMIAGTATIQDEMLPDAASFIGANIKQPTIFFFSASNEYSI